jgi:hypothetical protein
MSDPKPEAATLTDEEYARFVATMLAAPADANWDRGSLLVLCATIDADRQRIAALESRIAAALQLCDGTYWETGTWLTARHVRAALLREGDGA